LKPVAARTCPHCNQAMQNDWKNCPHCGQTL
jgi:RNA polymerase subunit RPABC4/transcription elongation factor Spt4